MDVCGRREFGRSLLSAAIAIVLVTSAFSVISAAMALPASSGEAPASSLLASSVGTFTPDYLLLGQLKGTDVVQTDLPRSLPLQAGTQFAANYYTPGDLRGAYGLSSLFGDEYEGQGKTIAIIDAYGDPEIVQDLNTFDTAFGLPSVNLTIIPVGPYQPNLGITTGWEAEVALDVEAAHMMAPLASINLVIASNDSNGLFYAIKDVVTEHLGNVVSMSWGEPENAIGNSGYTSDGYLGYAYADYYFALGASEGITFFSSSGDTGAYGGSTTTVGAASFPSSSPYVTSVGGTTLYVEAYSGSFEALNSSAVYQGEEAWSISPQYVGSQVSSGGGYSTLFAKPSYQDGVVTGDARAVPDVSADANPYTGMVIALDGGLYVEGGTSQASAMWAGIGAVLDEAVGHSLGALNPDLYSIYRDTPVYDLAFNQVTSGYNGAYSAGPGYNLVTGMGSPDVPYLAEALADLPQSLTASVSTNLAPLETLPQYGYGSTITIAASVKNPLGATVSGGSFSATIAAATGSVAVVDLSFNGSDWVGSYAVSDANPAGEWTITVSGSSQGLSANAATDVLVGMSLGLIKPVPYPYSDAIPPNQPFQVKVDAAYADGAPLSGASLTAYFDQGGRTVFSVHLSSVGGGMYTATPSLAPGMPQGTYELVVNGSATGSVYEYLYFGDGLVGALLTPTNEAIASVAPGQEVAFLAAPTTANSTGIYFGNATSFVSEVTAEVYNLEGVLVATVPLQPSPDTVQFGIYDFFSYYQANYTFPNYIESGFYSLVFTSTYTQNSTTGEQTGSYTTGFYVSGPTLSYTLVSPSVAIEGQYINVTASIVDSAGAPVDAGTFDLNVLPSQLAYASAYYGSLLLSGLPMQFNPSLGEWTGVYPIPSALTLPFYYSNDPAALAGSWTVFVSGEAPSAENVQTVYSYINVLPYTLLPYSQLSPSNVTGAELVTYNGTAYGLDDAGSYSLAVTGLSIVLEQDVFGNLTITDATVELLGSSADSIVAVDSTILLADGTSVGSMALAGSTVQVVDSSYESVSPALPTISVSGLSRPLSGVSNFTITVTGQQLSGSSLTATVDGESIPLFVSPSYGGLTATGTINASALADGVHILSVTAPQTDGLNSSYTAYFSTDAQVSAVQSQLSSEINLLNSTIQALQGTVNSLNSKLSSTTSNVGGVTDLAYVLAVVAIVALIAAAYATRRRGVSETKPAPPPAAESQQPQAPSQPPQPQGQPPSSPPPSGTPPAGTPS